MFTNVLKNKRLITGAHVESRHGGVLFKNDPLIVLDTLYKLYDKCGKGIFFGSILDDFLHDKYGIFDHSIKLQVYIRAMVISRGKDKEREYYFNKIIKLIGRYNGKFTNITDKCKNIINAEIGYHFINNKCDYNSAHMSYTRVIDSITNAMSLVDYGDGQEKINTIKNNIDLSNYGMLEHVYTIDDLIVIDNSDMYDVIRVGFQLHAMEKGTRKWFQWKKYDRYKELLVLVVELYSQLKYPICGNGNVIDAINECIITYTKDPPLRRDCNVNASVIANKYGVSFNVDTMKYKWYT